MAQIYTNNYLKDILNNIFIGNFNQLELANNFKTLIELENYPDSNNNFILLTIISLLEEYNTIPLLKTFTKQLKLKLIFSCYSAPENACCEQKTRDESNSNDKNEEETKKINRKSELNQKFWNRYANEDFSTNKNVKIPEPGELSIVGVYDDLLYPGIKYHMKFFIDHTGRVVKWHTPPRLYKKLEDSFDAIYQGLIGQIMDYQKLKNEEKSRD